MNGSKDRVAHIHQKHQRQQSNKQQQKKLYKAELAFNRTNVRQQYNSNIQNYNTLH